MRIVGIVPAAGRARRLQPLAGSKELLEVGGRPVMDVVLDRLVHAGVDEVRVVTRPDKEDVARRARERGATVVEGEPPSLAASVALGAAGLGAADVALLGLPDTIWEPADGFTRLLAALGAEDDAALGLFRSADAARSDVVSLGEDGRVTAVAVKPRRPASDLIWGCAALRARALAGLRDAEEPGHHFDALSRRGRVRGVRLSGPYLDIGTPDALRRALAEAAA